MRSRPWSRGAASSPGGEISGITDYLIYMTQPKPERAKASPQPSADGDRPPATVGPRQKPGEIGGRKGPEPTRYGDWEVDGRSTDF